MEKMASDGPKWGREDFFPTDPDLADILGRTDLDFEHFYVFLFLGPQISGFPGPQISKIWPWPGLGWVRPGLSHLDQKILIFYYKYWCLSLRPPVSCRRDESNGHQVCILIDQHERQPP